MGFHIFSFIWKLNIVSSDCQKKNNQMLFVDEENKRRGAREAYSTERGVFRCNRNGLILMLLDIIFPFFIIHLIYY